MCEFSDQYVEVSFHKEGVLVTILYSCCVSMLMIINTHEVYTSVDYPITGELYSSSLLETSLSVFSLHNSMDSLSCFSVARNVDYSTPGVIDFPRTIASFGTDWDGSNNRYVAPESGTYFFTFSAGVHETSTARLQLTVDGVVQAELRRDHTNNNNDFTFARLVV